MELMGVTGSLGLSLEDTCLSYFLFIYFNYSNLSGPIVFNLYFLFELSTLRAVYLEFVKLDTSSGIRT